jgi:hypothetical protein
MLLSKPVLPVLTTEMKTQQHEDYYVDDVMMYANMISRQRHIWAQVRNCSISLEVQHPNKHPQISVSLLHQNLQRQRHKSLV